VTALLLAAGDLGTAGQLLSVAAPVLVAVVGGLFGYRQAVKVADRSSTVEGRKLTLAEYESLNKGLREEIERLRSDRGEDEERFEKRIGGLETRTQRLESQRAVAEQSLALLIGWARMALGVLSRPEVAAALRQVGAHIPAPPELDDDRTALWTNVRTPDG
jgi:hypothetical protein